MQIQEVFCINNQKKNKIYVFFEKNLEKSKIFQKISPYPLNMKKKFV
jgi:hypothetical protein